MPAGRLALLEGQVGGAVAEQVAVDGAAGMTEMGRRVRWFCLWFADLTLGGQGALAQNR